MKITTGKQNRPLRVVLYGCEGIGKTSLAAKFPDPLFIDTEDGTSQFDVKRTEKPQNWMELVQFVQEVAQSDVCKTLVIDTADWAEILCSTHVCNAYNQKSIESFGYGKGYVYLSEEFSKLLGALDGVINSGKHVVITAHAKMRKFEQPDEMGAYDRWEMKLSRQVAPLLKEWADMVLFLNYKTFAVKADGEKKYKAQGGQRVMYASHNPCWDAKNRQGLPDEMPLDYGSIAHVIGDFEKKPIEKVIEKAKENGVPVAEEPPLPWEEEMFPALSELRWKMHESGISEEELLGVAVERGKAPAGVPLDMLDEGFVKNWALKYFDKVLEAVTKRRNA